MRSFSVDAIEQVEILEKRTKDVPDKRLDEVVGSGYGIFAAENVTWATFKFTPERARWVENARWHSKQESGFLKDGSYELLAYVSPHAPDATGTLNQRGIPTFDAPESCAAALSAMLQSARWREAVAPHGDAGAYVPTDDLRPGSLNEAEAKQLFARFGIPSVRESVVTTPEEAVSAASRFGGKVVLKILSSEITHKSDVGGVAVNVESADAGARLLAMAADVKFRTGHSPEAFVVQEMLAGTELILGFHRDPLGTAILLGMGSVTAELFNDTTLRLLAEGQ